VKVFLDTNVWLSATVFSGLCEAIVMECHQRDWLLTTPLVRQEAQAVLDRKFAQVLQAGALFDAIWSEAACVVDVAEPADDNDARLVKAALAAGADVFVTGDRRALGWGAQGAMQILSPRDAWMLLFAQSNQA
jgi:predicted nucleic acid-binding protein